MSNFKGASLYAILKVLSKGLISKGAATVIYDHLDVAMKGDLDESELAFFIAVIVAHKVRRSSIMITKQAILCCFKLNSSLIQTG